MLMRQRRIRNPFLDAKNIDHIAMDMSPSYISGAEQYLPDSAMVFDHFPFMKKWISCSYG